MMFYDDKMLMARNFPNPEHRENAQGRKTKSKLINENIFFFLGKVVNLTPLIFFPPLVWKVWVEF